MTISHTETPRPDSPPGTGRERAETSCPRARQPSLAGEPTATPGLLITPTVGLDDAHYTGGWSVVHAGSGLSVGGGDLPLVYARQLATLLGDLDVDWTRHHDQFVIPGFHLLRAVCVVHVRVAQAWQAGRPVWYARDSWQHHAPAWTLEPADWDQPTYGFDTWRELETWVSDYDVDPDDIDAVRITREPDPTWTLRCAAPTCDDQGQPAVLSYDHIDYGETRTRARDRGDLAREARQAGWTRHDPRHWICRACTHAHIPPADPDRAGS
jgi:hypothetical protein